MFSLACRIATYLLDGDGFLLLVSGLESLPSIFGRDVAYTTIEGEEAVGIAVSSDVALSLADTAGLRSLVRAVGLAMARLATATALAGELALNPLVRALGGVVAGLVTVVAQAGIEALLFRLGAVASEVTVAAAAAKRRVSRVLETLPGSGRTHLRQPLSSPACLETFWPM